ncbi:heavy metal translocating P-type ATPase [Clostridium sp. Marseille-P299]|uniref:heavy metal translocating P-type ATPase n=1 Tax=Clostridium sp. Marseille-P299 TaxID=1805477 RepID=UPI00082BCAEE|nr:cation-translocating P-type ATPase [Clostridium sp. Marseille-P299]
MFSKAKDFMYDETKRSILFLILSGISLVISFFDLVNLPFNIAWVAIILCGIPIILEGIEGLVTRFDIKADVLVSLALIASVIIGEIFAAGEVAFIMQIGALLEELTVAKARAGIEKLVHLTPRTARVIKNGREVIVTAQEVKIDDIIRVLPGETIALDGIIIDGQTSIDQSIMTGESLPVDKQKGDEVSSGTVNQFGAFDMIATKLDEDSSVQRLIKLVQSADAGKAKIVGIMDKWATWIVVIALVSAFITGIVTGEIIRAVTILVVFCPCALILATPTAIMAAIGNVTKYGILVRNGDALEKLSQVKRITFDKTGTLTYGKPNVIHIKSFSDEYSEDEIFRLAALAEMRSEHPIGKAVVLSYTEKYGEISQDANQFQMIPSRGVSAVIDDKNILAGNNDLLYENSVIVSSKQQTFINTFLDKGCIVIHIAIDKKLTGIIALSDTLRKDSPSMIQRIKTLGIKPVLLTGDHIPSAKQIAKTVGIEDFKAECLPEDKLKAIDAYHQKKELVCMVGDGINDAPALKKAHVGIAMGGIGSDIAVDAADIVLVSDDISQLPHLLALSKKMMSTIKLNLCFSMGLNFIAILLAITGVLNPVVGALVHNVGSVLVIINSAFLLRWKKSNF